MTPVLAESIFGTPNAMAVAVLAILAAALLAAAWSDCRRRRIPNAVVLPGMLLAVFLHAVLPGGDGFVGPLPGGLGAWAASKGLAFGLLALLPMYLLRSMGAGDVKLMAMVGAFVGPVHIWPVIFAAVLAGGGLAVAVALRHGVLLRALNNVRLVLFGGIYKLAGAQPPTPAMLPASTARLPYGAAIAAGSLGYLIYQARLNGLF